LNGAQRRNRTTDTRIFNPLLYRLSYLGMRDVAGLAGVSLAANLARRVLNPQTMG
jgi:hypothetical protein